MVANTKESAVKEKILLAKHLENFFEEKGERKRFGTLINHYKFESKHYYMREKKDIRTWKSIYPECHKDIFKFKQLTLIGRMKWWCCAHVPFLNLLIKEK